MIDAVVFAVWRCALNVKHYFFILAAIVLGVSGILQNNSSAMDGSGGERERREYMVKNIKVISAGRGLDVRVVLSKESNPRSEYYRKSVFSDVDLGALPAEKIFWKGTEDSGEHYPVGIFMAYDSGVGIVSDRKHAYRVYRSARSRLELDYTISKDQIGHADIDGLIFDLDRGVFSALQEEIRGME